MNNLIQLKIIAVCYVLTVVKLVIKTNYIDFHENRYRIHKKSIYIHKYHVQNVLSDIELKNKLPISRNIINCVCQTFDLINTILSQVNQNRKRIISIKFIIHKLFKMWNNIMKSIRKNSIINR